MISLARPTPDVTVLAVECVVNRLIVVDHRRGRDLEGKTPRKMGALDETLKTTC